MMDGVPVARRRHGKGPRTKRKMRAERVRKQNAVMQAKGIKFGRKLKQEARA